MLPIDRNKWTLLFNLYRYSIENSYLEEKEDACNSIREIAENVGRQFYPYLDECYQQVNILTEVHTVSA